MGLNLDVPEAAKALVDEADAKIIPDLIAAVQPIVEAANEIKALITRINALLDVVTKSGGAA